MNDNRNEGGKRKRSFIFPTEQDYIAEKRYNLKTPMREIGLHLLIDEKYNELEKDFIPDIKKAFKRVSRVWEIQFGIKFVVKTQELWDLPLPRLDDFWDAKEISEILDEHLRLEDILIGVTYHEIRGWNRNRSRSLLGRLVAHYSEYNLDDGDQKIVIGGFQNSNRFSHIVSHELGHCFGAFDLGKNKFLGSDDKTDLPCVMNYNYVLKTMRFCEYNVEKIIGNKNRVLKP